MQAAEQGKKRGDSRLTAVGIVVRCSTILTRCLITTIRDSLVPPNVNPCTIS